MQGREPHVYTSGDFTGKRIRPGHAAIAVVSHLQHKMLRRGLTSRAKKHIRRETKNLE